jgi:hypothetical protein
MQAKEAAPEPRSGGGGPVLSLNELRIDGCGHSNRSSTPHGKADREQITGILESWEKAWNSHDMRALAALFHEDGILDSVDGRGVERKNRDRGRSRRGAQDGVPQYGSGQLRPLAAIDRLGAASL